MSKIKKYQFQSEIKQLLHIMIHSLYSNKEIFLRELISNASDALDKLRFLNITSKKNIKNNEPLRIRISINSKNKELIIDDNGIGMTEQEIIENLGTIAKSGTKKFLENMKNSKDKNISLIGKFGVGFYSSFIVSDSVCVHTRSIHAKSQDSVLWKSSGHGDYSIEKKEKKNIGTKIILNIKKEDKEFLELWKIENVIKKYSNHINFPVEIQKNEEIKIDKTKEIKKEKKTIWNQINKSNALWTLNKSEIKEEEYINFYKEFTNDTQPPLFWIHNKVEGNTEYTSLLYIPQKSPWEMWNRENKYGLKLYIKKVFIMENTNQLLPNYLRFVKGIVDANELPLNISREVLQKNTIVKNLKKTITKKTLNLLQKISKKNPEKYQKFWNEFGIIFKEGPAEDIENKNIILDLLRFTSINNKNTVQNLSLNQYVKNMLPHQEKIYFITSDNYKSAKDSPHLELFKKKSIDVLLLSDRVDEWMMNYVHEFDGKNFQSINKQDNSIEKLIKQDKQEHIDNNIINLLEKIKILLKKDITDVKITHKLFNTPAVLVTDSNEMTTQMAKLFSSAGQKIPPLKYVLEINPNHNLIKKISLIKNEELIKEWILFLFEQTLLIEKGNLENPNKFITRINKILTL